jgi:hypothetical protein
VSKLDEELNQEIEEVKEIAGLIKNNKSYKRA